MATQPPVALDISIQNIERICTITHLSKFNDDECKRIKACFVAGRAKFEKPAEEEEVKVGGDDSEQIIILLISDVQPGKSSLVETLRLYADPTYVVNTQCIMQGKAAFLTRRSRSLPSFLTCILSRSIKNKTLVMMTLLNLMKESRD